VIVMSSFTAEELNALGRKELQALAKKHGVKANLKSADIIEKLNELIPKAPPKPVVASPPPKQSTPPQSPMQRISQIKCAPSGQKNAFVALKLSTPQKTPILSKTPGRGYQVSTMVTPRRKMSAVKKNLFKPAVVAAPDIELPEDNQVALYKELNDKYKFQVEVFPVHGQELNEIWAQVKHTHEQVIDSGATRLVASLVSYILHDVTLRAMASEGVRLRNGFKLQQDTIDKIFKTVLFGSLHDHATAESLNARKRYAQVPDKTADTLVCLLGLTCNFQLTLDYFQKLAVDIDTETAIGLTACLEYIAAEIFDLCEGKEFEGVALANPADIVFAVTTDEELKPTFQAALDLYREQSQQKEAQDTANITALIPATDGASAAELAVLEEALQFSLPPALSLLLSRQNGSTALCFDSCHQIYESITFYSTQLNILKAMNWIPLHYHHDGDTWDCLDCYGHFVVRASFLHEPLASRYPIVAYSLGEYLEKASKGPIEPTSITLLAHDRIAADLSQFWISFLEDDDLDEQMQLD